MPHSSAIEEDKEACCCSSRAGEVAGLAAGNTGTAADTLPAAVAFAAEHAGPNTDTDNAGEEKHLRELPVAGDHPGHQVVACPAFPCTEDKTAGLLAERDCSVLVAPVGFRHLRTERILLPLLLAARIVQLCRASWEKGHQHRSFLLLP